MKDKIYKIITKTIGIRKEIIKNHENTKINHKYDKEYQRKCQ